MQYIELIDVLAKKHWKHMFQLAYRKTGDERLAEDLTQQTFKIACEKVEELAVHKNPDAWLYTALNYVIMREMAKAYRKEEYLEEDMIGEKDIELPMEAYFPEGLTAGEKALLKMRTEQKLSFADIAQVLGIEVAACRQRYLRIRKKCRILMGDLIGEKKTSNECHKTVTSRNKYNRR